MVQSYDQMLKAHNPSTAATGDAIVEDLRKALSTTTSGPGGIQGGPLMLENLDGVMTEVLVTEQHFKLFNLLPKVPSAQPYYEYNVHKGFGSNRGSIGFAQGGAPKGGVSSFKREGTYTKYLGVKGGITHQMLITGQNGGSFEDPTVRENKDRTLELLERLERELVFGSSLILDGNGNEIHFDGLLKQLTTANAANVIDLKGEPLTFNELDACAESLITTGKQPTVNGYQVLMSPHVSMGLNKQYSDRDLVRFNKDTAQGVSYVPGFSMPKYDSQFGTFNFDHSILLQEVEGGKPLQVTPLIGAPASPAYDATGQPAATADATVHIPAATYYYHVAAFNDTGESIATTSNPVAVADGQKVTIVVNATSGATGYRIYRGKLADASDALWIAKVPATVANADLTFVDDGSWGTYGTNNQSKTIPGPLNGLALVIKPSPADIAIAQMAPLVKMPLPQVDTTYPFLLLLYIVSVIKAPERVMIFKNCGVYNTP